jgi:hypothetical protein
VLAEALVAAARVAGLEVGDLILTQLPVSIALGSSERAVNVRFELSDTS